jgi:hypothetical protein
MPDDVIRGLTTVLVIGLALGLLGLLIGASRRAARKPKSWTSGAGWALLFFASGRMPPPPPASQIEAELNGEKYRLESHSVDPDG